MRSLTSRTAEHGNSAIAVEKRSEPIDIDLCRHRNRLPGQQARHFRQRRVRGGLKGNVAHHAEIDRRAAADLFGPHIHLRDAYPRTAWIELTVWKISAEHQENVAIEHGVVARREADQSSHADVERIVPLHMFLASERVHDGSLQAVR